VNHLLLIDDFKVILLVVCNVNEDPLPTEMYCGITRRKRDMLVVSQQVLCLRVITILKKNGTSVHHSICVHIGNKLFIVHMALPFIVFICPLHPRTSVSRGLRVRGRCLRLALG